MVEKFKTVNPANGLSLRDLDVKPGEIIGLKLRLFNPQISLPFLVGIVGQEGLKRKGTLYDNRDPNFLLLRQKVLLGINDYYIVHFPNKVFRVNGNGVSISEESSRSFRLDTERPYFVESAYAGRGAILNALREEGRG